jgi:IclR family transcriptional regulator, pca regulon regulatory protein
VSTSRPGSGSDIVQSLERGLAVLTAFSASRPRMTLSEAAAATGVTRPTARRMLLTLEHLGYVRSRGRDFELTPKVLEIGYAFLSATDLAGLAQGEMEDLVERTAESCSVSVLDGHEVVYVARVPTKRIMTISLGLGSRLPAYATSMGRVLLSGLPVEEQAALLDASDLQRLTSRTLVDRDELLAEIAVVAERGWSLVDQELEQGVRSISAPLHDRTGAVVAAMNLGTHASRVTLARLRDELLPLLRDSAARVSEDLARCR